jgi:hypothetical protein
MSAVYFAAVVFAPEAASLLAVFAAEVASAAAVSIGIAVIASLSIAVVSCVVFIWKSFGLAGISPLSASTQHLYCCTAAIQVLQCSKLPAQSVWSRLRNAPLRYHNTLSDVSARGRLIR